MKIVLLTPGTGSYHCGVCMRDNALAKELRRQGHDAVMLPMYLPLTLDEEPASTGEQIFFGGVSTYLREKAWWLRKLPRWLDRMLSQRALLKLLAGKAAARTGGPDVAEMTLSMLRGEKGNQAAEVDELIRWLQESGKPDAVWISTALQAGLARALKEKLGVPVVGFLQGEDSFIDGLGAPYPEQVWTLLSERMRDALLWIAPSRYFADRMAQRLRWTNFEAATLIRVIPNGGSFDGYPAEPPSPPSAPVIGYLARMIPEKGLGVLVDAFLELKGCGRFPALRLHCAGSMTGADETYVNSLRARIAAAGFEKDVLWHPNVTREEKITFLSKLTLFSVPATYSEAFGLYTIEALAAGIPLVLPNSSAFPEIIATTGGGMLFPAGSNEQEQARNLAAAMAELLENPEEVRRLAARGHAAVRRDYQMSLFAQRLVEATREMIDAARRAP